MGISVVNYTVEDKSGRCWGVMRAGEVYPLEGHYPSHRELMACYFSAPDDFTSRISEVSLDARTVQFNSPVTQDIQLYCQGLNYADHRAESGVTHAEDGENLVFMKAASSICAPNETILRPPGCRLLDYEIELALVLKEGISQAMEIKESDLPKYIGGLVLCNDVSARDFMFGAPMLQWFKGKSQRTFCPMGPVLYLLDVDDFRYLFDLQLTLMLNGDIKQFASTGQLINRPAQTLSEISSFADLRAGDCLLTGTPGGVLAQVNLKVGLSIILNFKNDGKRRRKFTEAQLAQARFLEPGDVLDLSIQTADGAIDLGRQHNEIADAGT